MKSRGTLRYNRKSPIPREIPSIPKLINKAWQMPQSKERKEIGKISNKTSQHLTMKKTLEEEWIYWMMGLVQVETLSQSYNLSIESLYEA
jgi:hypothetical protein